MDETTQTLDQEDQMAAALAELRAGKTETETPAEPVVEAVAPFVPAANESPEAPAAQAAVVNPADELSKTQAELQKARSEIGRVNALNRLYNETRQQAEALMRENAELKQTRQAVAQPETVDEATAELAAVAEKVKDFPELAGIVAAVTKALKNTDTKAAKVAEQAAAQVVQPLEGLRTEAEQRRQQEHQAAYQAAMGTFQSTYPTAVDVVKSQEFNAWIGAAPKPVQDAFKNGSTPDEALAVLDAYDAHLRRAGRQSIAQYPNRTQPQTEAAKPAVRNAQRLQSAAGLPSRASGAKGGLPPEDDFEASLKYFRAKSARAA